MPEIVFSSQISTFSVPAGKSPATVVVKDAAGAELFCNQYNTELAFGVCGIDAVIETDLRKKKVSSGDYVLEAFRPGSGGAASKIASRSLSVIYHEKWNADSIDAADFLKKNFLLECNEMVVPAKYAANIPIEIWTEKYESCNVTQYWTENGRQQSAVISYPVAKGGDTITLYAAFAREHAPMSAILECGQRRAVVKFTADSSSDDDARAFTFRNMFNALETVWLSGVLSESPSAQKTTASFEGSKKALDIVPDPSYTLKVAGLTLPEAIRARRMLYSREVTVDRLLTPGQPQQITVTYVSGDISDDRASLCDITIKFTRL